jgi:hypothetical protein
MQGGGPEAFLSEVSDALIVLHDTASGVEGGSVTVGRVFQLCLPQWAITDENLTSLDPFWEYEIHLSRLDEMDWDWHME